MIVTAMAEIRTFGDWMKAMRRERKLTQDELAEQTQLSRTYIIGVEKGRTRLPQQANREKLHAVFGTNDGELEDMGLIAFDSFGTAFLVAPDDEPLITYSLTQRNASKGGATVSQAKALIDVVRWDDRRLEEITERLFVYIREDQRGEPQ